MSVAVHQQVQVKAAYVTFCVADLMNALFIFTLPSIQISFALLVG